MSTPSPANPAKYAILAVVLTAVLMSVLDGIVVGIALPTITSSFQTSVAVSQWTIIAYLLILTALLLVFGRAAEWTGRPALFISGLAVFTLASLACGLSRSIALLIAFRAVQAVGGAMTFSISGAILYAAFRPEERGRAMGFLGSTVAVGSILGAVLIAASIPLLRRQESRRSAASRMDWAGAALLAAALTALTLCLGAAARGATPFSVFPARRRLPPGRGRFPPVGNEGTGSPAGSGILPQPRVHSSSRGNDARLMGYTPSQVGLVFLVVPAVTVIASPLSGWLFDKHHWKHYGRLGMAVVELCLLALGLAALRIDFRPMVPLFALLGLGSALFQSPNSTEIMNAFPREKAAVASSITATVRNLGMTVGTAVGTLLISAQLAGSGYAGAILQADGPLLARVLGVTILASGAVAAASSLSL